MKRGLVIGGLIALAIAGASVYDDYRMHRNAIEYLGMHESMWIPDPLETLIPVAVALVAFGLIARAVAKGRSAWPLAASFGVLGGLLTAWRTVEVAHYPGDATTFRMVVIPIVLAAALLGGLVLARRPQLRC